MADDHNEQPERQQRPTGHSHGDAAERRDDARAALTRRFLEQSIEVTEYGGQQPEGKRQPEHPFNADHAAAVEPPQSEESEREKAARKRAGAENHVRLRTAEKITLAETVAQLALRFWAMTVAQKV